jgi:hypothetical protein
MSDEVKFCYKCGANLPAGADFCPECGANVGSANGDSTRTEYTARPVRDAKDAISPFPMLIMIYGVLSVIGGVLIFIVGISIDAILNMMLEALKEGYITEEDYELFVSYTKLLNIYACTTVGVLHILSGILAFLAGSWASDLVKWQSSVVCCAVAAILPALYFVFDPYTAILLPVIGLLMTYILYSKRDLFTS